MCKHSVETDQKISISAKDGGHYLDTMSNEMYKKIPVQRHGESGLLNPLQQAAGAALGDALTLQHGGGVVQRQRQ